MASGAKLSKVQIASLIYHDIWNYPLTEKELYKWFAGPKALSLILSKPSGSNLGGWEGIVKSEGFYALNKKAIVKRLQNEKHSKSKIKIARLAANKLKLIPTIQFIGITGSLAMNNAEKGSDIDLMIVTQKGTLWVTRLITFFHLKLLGFRLRRAGEREVSNALCLNIWADINSLGVDKKARNIYTAHEIAQIKPLINKNKTYESLIVDNAWIKDYWPNTVEPGNFKKSVKSTSYQHFLLWPIEELAYRFQLSHMKGKRTREVVSRNKAFFHPKDWSSEVKKKLNQS